jgi:hypothetical protein
MAKQIKLGLDRNSSRPVTSDQILVDVGGNFLRDGAENFLYTETNEPPRSFFSELNSTSVHINNESTLEITQGGSVAIQEQFPETSQVSSSLLGIPRSQGQQTLLADVSIYGQDENTWEFYRNPTPFQPIEWRTRLNRTYGNRYDPRLTEYPTEQALALEVFPTPWTFPYGPRWESQGRYNETLFLRYMRFIQLGNDLYEKYVTNFPVFANRNFLDRDIVEVDGDDVIYKGNFDLALEKVEQWTMAWMDIRDGRLNDPERPGQFINEIRLKNLEVLSPGDTLSSATSPGYSSTPYRYCQLQSKESFRYQPGAISGFTFGIKLNSDPTTLTNTLEWGCANESDQLMFQVRGLQFSIVRRSTVPLTRKNLELNGFTVEDQIQIQPPNPFERNDNQFTTEDLGIPSETRPQMYELRIPSDKFNGDPLNGSGPSGYTISSNEVTMYKIEYSWYGAIGAKFYAYVPVGNAETRWVLIHTLVIENTLDEPSLKNPFMHFRYVIYLNDTSSLREPMYLYKYGASYYIDGDDEGTFSYNSYKIPTEKSISSVNSVPLLGFFPKDVILNRDRVGNFNQKNFYIDKISASSDKDARIDLLECTGCPGGHGHFYATSLQNGQKGKVGEFRITSGGDLVYVDTELEFSPEDNNKKIIAPGVYSSYIFSKEVFDSQAMSIRKRVGSQRINNQIDSVIGVNDQALVSGEVINLLSANGYTFTGRLTGYDDVIASTVPITKPNVKVQFLNPVRTETTNHWTEFRIGITPKKPEVAIPEEGDTEVLLFDGEPLILEDEISGEFSQFQARKNIQGVEIGEVDPRYGNQMVQDPRIGRPSGASSGDCSELNFEIRDVIITGVSYTITNPNPESELISDHFIIFNTRPPEGLTGGGIGVLDSNGNRFVDSNITLASDAEAYFDNEGNQRFVAAISGDIGAAISVNGIAIRRVRCFGRFINISRIFPFSSQEYYLFVAMRDNARINNIVVKEFDEVSAFSHTPNWIKDDNSNISITQLQNVAPSASIIDKLSTSREYIDLDGRFNMGGITTTGNSPANFVEKNRLDSVQFDNQLSLPLRPSSLKTSFYITGGSTEIVDMNHIFNIDRFKLSKGSFNNKYLHISSIITEPNENGTIQINVSGREQ